MKIITLAMVMAAGYVQALIDGAWQTDASAVDSGLWRFGALIPVALVVVVALAYGAWRIEWLRRREPRHRITWVRWPLSTNSPR